MIFFTFCFIKINTSHQMTFVHIHDPDFHYYFMQTQNKTKTSSQFAVKKEKKALTDYAT